MNTESFLAGQQFRMYALREEDGKIPVEEFIRNLNGPERKKLLALLEFSSNNGPPKNEEKSRKIEGSNDLYEFKSSQDRLFYFYDGRDTDRLGRIVMTNGYKHKSERMQTGDRRHLARAGDMLQRYRKGKG